MGIKEEDEEFAALGGKTRLVSRKSPAYSSPSPQGSSQQSSVSPVEQSAPLYMSPETPPSTIEATSPVIPESTQWNGGGYMQTTDVYGYPYTAPDMNDWQQGVHAHPQPQPQPQPSAPGPQHVPAHMQGLAVDIGQVQYGGYDHLGQHNVQMASPHHAHPHHHHHPQHGQYVAHSPVQTHHHMGPSDPTTSWNYLFAQFNQV